MGVGHPKEPRYSASVHSAGSDGKRPDKQKLERARPKNETASNTGSNDSRSVPPRGFVAAMATCFVGVQTEDPACGALSLWDQLTPATVTSTATQLLHQWRSIQEQYWLELHSILFSPLSTSGGTLGDRRALTLTLR